MVKTEKFEKVEVRSSGELRSWLVTNHSQAESVWLITYKKDHPLYYVTRWEVLDELLCFGWIDGMRRKLDAERTMQLISPRKAEHWAKTYKFNKSTQRKYMIIAKGHKASTNWVHMKIWCDPAGGYSG